MLEPTEALRIDPLTLVVHNQWRHKWVKLNAMRGRTKACTVPFLNQEVGKG